MKKKFFVFILSQINIIILFAQIGVVTESPLGIFHVDPQSNTNASTESTFTDDAIFRNGNLGLGVVDPAYKLDMSQSFRYQKAPLIKDYVMRVDVNKNLFWGLEELNYPRYVGLTATEMHTLLFNYKTHANRDVMTYTGVRLVLDPGRWLVYLRVPLDTWWGPRQTGNIIVELRNGTINAAGTHVRGVSQASTNGGIAYVNTYFLVECKAATGLGYFLWLGYESQVTAQLPPSYKNDVTTAGNGTILNAYYAVRLSD